MANELYKKIREVLIIPPPPPPPPPRRKVRKSRTTRRPVYSTVVTSYVSGGSSADASYGGGGNTATVTTREELTGYEDVTEYYLEEEPETVVKRTPPKVVPVAPAWDATAISTVSLMSPLEASFSPGDVQVDKVVGLAPLVPIPGSDPGNLLAAVTHGFRITGGRAYLHVAAPLGVFPTKRSLAQRHGSLPAGPGSVLRVRMSGGSVAYTVDNEVLAVGPSYLSGMAVVLRAALYGVEEFVANPQFGPAAGGGEGVAQLQFAALGGRRGFGRAAFVLDAAGPDGKGGRASLGPVYSRGASVRTGFGTADLGSLWAEGWGMRRNTGRGQALLPKVAALGGKTGQGEARFVLFAWGRQRDVPPQALMYTELGGSFAAAPPPGAWVHQGAFEEATVGMHFEVSHHNAARTADKMSVRASHAAAKVLAAKIGAMLGAGFLTSAGRVLDVALVAGVDAAAPLHGILVLTGEHDAGLQVGAPLTGVRTVSERLEEGLALEIGATPQHTLQAALHALMRAGVQTHEPGANQAVWSVHAETGGSTAYEDFPFNSFAQIGGRYFGAAPGGLFELEGDTDNGAPIRASLHLGKRNFGSTQLKGISYCYMAVSSEGRMVVRVTTPEGQSYLYRTRRADDFMRVQRADFGRGLRANYLGLEIYNEDGADFELEQLEFAVNAMTRRI